MAIQFFGAGTPFVPVGLQTTAVLPSPASVPSGAIMLAGISLNSQTPTLTPPAGEGWASVLAPADAYAPLSGLSQRFFWKVSDGSEPATHDFVISGTGNQVSGGIVAYTGVDTATPFDVAYQALSGDSDLFIEFPAITPTTAGAWIVRYGTANLGSTNPTGISGPSGYTARMVSLHRRPTYIADIPWAGGTEAAADATLTSSVSGTSTGITIALRPSSGAGDTTPPSDVTGLGASSSSTQITLNWNAATDDVAVQGYNIFRSTSSGGTYTQIGTSATTSYIDSPTTAGTYYYKVKARDTSANLSTNFSNIVSGTTTAVASNGTVRFRRVGAATDTGFVCGAQFLLTTNVRLKVSTAADLSTSPVFFGPVAVDAEGYAKVAATGLSPNTQYYYGWEVDSSMAPLPSGRTNHGQCKTFPTAGQAASFKFVSGSCQTSLSNSTTFTQIITEAPLFTLHLGDEHYDDINDPDQSAYRSVYESQISQVNQQNMECVIPMAYMYNDHDFCGNNSARDFVGDGSVANVGRAAVQAVYRQIFPHYSLPATTGAIWHTFTVGRFKFFVMDTRSESTHRSATDNSSKTKLGTEQKNALKQWLLDNKTAPKIIVTGEAFHNSTAEGGDGWNNYSTERAELVNYISTNGITNGVWLGGDAHSVSYADAADGTPAGWPTIGTSPFDQDPSHKGGPWAKRYPDPLPGDGLKIQQYGALTVTDTGGTTATLTVGFRSGTGTTLLGPDTVITFTGIGAETLRPTSIVGTPTNLTGAVTDIDQDPDGTITDAGLVGTDPSGSPTTHGVQDPNTQALWTGSTAHTWTNPANVFDTNDTTIASYALAANSVDYMDMWFYAAADFTGIPSNATITNVAIVSRWRASTTNRLTAWVQLATNNNVLLGNEQAVNNGTALSSTLTSYNNTHSGTMPTRAELVSGTFGVRTRIRRSNTVTAELARLTLAVTYTVPGSTVNTQVDVAMGNPVGNLATGAGTGEIRSRLRKKGTGSNPQGRIEIRNAAGTLLGTPVIDRAITESDADGQTANAFFNQSIILDKDDVVFRMVGTGASGGLTELVAVEWNAQIAAGALEITKTVTDALGITDAAARVRAISRAITDALGITDSRTALIVKMKTVTDALGVTDLTSVTRGHGRTVTDPVGITDSATRTRGIARTQTDALGATDAATKVLTRVRTLSDSLGITDVASRSLGRALTVSDTLGVTDAASALRSKAFTVTDALGITDNNALVRTVARTLGDNLGITDAANRSRGYGRTVADNLGVTDSASALKFILRTLTDGVGIVDSQVRSVGRNRTLTDNLGITDNASRALTLVIAKTVTDALGIVDSRTILKNVSRTLNDSLGVVDSRTVTFGRARTVADTLGVTDAAARVLNRTRTVTDPLGITDTVIRTRSVARTIADNLGITDSATRQLLLVIVKVVTDSLGIADSRTLVKAYGRTVNDTVGINDSRTVTKNMVKSVVDTLGLTDGTTKVMTRSRAITDALGIVDNALPLKISFIQRTITDSVGITDTRTAQVFRLIARSVNDTLGITDTRARHLGILRTDNLGITDATQRTMARIRTVTDELGLSDNMEYARVYNRVINDSVNIPDGVGRSLAKYVDLTDILGMADGVEFRIIGVTVAPFATVELIAIPTATVELLGIPSAIVELLGIPSGEVTLEP